MPQWIDGVDELQPGGKLAPLGIQVKHILVVLMRSPKCRQYRNVLEGVADGVGQVNTMPMDFERIANHLERG
jgi:hypothetical protein